jgi:hypothetical protein
MISSEVALVDTRQVQYGSVIVKRALHITLVLRYEEAKWRIAAMRVAAPCINVVRPAATALTRHVPLEPAAHVLRGLFYEERKPS